MSIFDLYDREEPLPVNRTEEIDYSYADPETIEENVVESTPTLVNKWHIITVSTIVIALFVRLAYVQIVQGRDNANLAKEHSIRQVIETAKRGAILDSRGVWLARNTPNFRVQVSPNDLPRQHKDRTKIYDSMAVILGWSDDQKKTMVEEIESRLGKQIDPVIVKDTIGHDEALLLTEKLNALPAVSVAAEQIRQYNLGLTVNLPSDKPRPSDLTNSLAHILGYVGSVSDQDIEKGSLRRTDSIGKSGLELSYDADLRGKNGVLQAVVDSRGKILRSVSNPADDPLAGSNLALHVDLKLQSIMTEALQNGLDKAGLKSGVAIAMDPRDGAVKGMVSLPAYDNNQFSGGIPTDLYSSLTNNPAHPLFNRATQGTYPSGSTIKPFVAAIGLQEGVITEKTHIDTPAEIQIGQQVFPNWQHFFISNVDVKTAIAHSNDIFFYAVGGGYDKIKGLGVDRLAAGLPKFGFGDATSIDLPTEHVGRVPTPDWKKQHQKEPWYIGDTYHMSIGQGDLLVTPLQLTTALAAIANGGTLYEPHVVDRIVDQNGNTVRTITPKVVRDHFISDDNIRIVREGMRQTVTDGSGRQLQSLSVEAAAKTGTAQVGANNEFLDSWFEVFAPYNNPEIVLVVLGERGSQENEGHTTAEPIAKTILEQYFSEDFKK